MLLPSQLRLVLGSRVGRRHPCLRHRCRLLACRPRPELLEGRRPLSVTANLGACRVRATVTRLRLPGLRQRLNAAAQHRAAPGVQQQHAQPDGGAADADLREEGEEARKGGG